MEKLEIFDQVVKLMKEDSATKKDIQGANPALFRAQISEEMSDDDFLYVMRSYLASFGVISHVSFHPKKPEALGFRLRVFEQRLFVEWADEATGLRKGDEIVAVAGKSIEETFQEHRAYFVSQTPERHYLDWARLLKYLKDVIVARGGEKLAIHLSDPSDTPASLFEHYALDEQTYYMKMGDFSNELAIGQLYEQVFPKLATIKNLIIDVRVNHGGSDSLYFPLLKYLLPAGKGFNELELKDEDYGMEILYTPTNVAHRLAQFDEFLQEERVSEETRHQLEVMSADLKANQDKGYVVYGAADEDGEDIFTREKGLVESPERVILLADVMCGSSGDNFVDLMKKMPKVTVVGRPTLGILDYANCCTADFGDFSLLYPTSRWLALDAGKGMTDKGVLPDVFVPWTPKHLERDVDLEVALQLLKEA